MLLDVDGVLADFTSEAINFLNENGVAKTYEDVTRWDIFEGDTELEDKFKETYASRPGFCYNLQPLDGAVDFVRRARKNYDITILTTPYDVPNWYEERKDWVVDVLGLSRTCITYTHHKEYVEGDVFVEDKFENAARWCKHWAGRRRCLPVLVDRPWNRHKTQEGVMRVHDWKELADYLQEYDLPSV